MCTIYSRSVKLGGRKLSSSGDTIGTLRGVAPNGIRVGSRVCDVDTCTSYTNYHFIYLFG